MPTRWGDLDPTFTLFDELRRRMDRVWDDFEPREPDRAAALSPTGWPRMEVRDAGSDVVVEVDVPGLGEKDLTLTLHENTLTLAGERKTETPEGHLVHRRERVSAKFSRTLAMPVKVDPERATASLRDGVLTVTLAKATSAQPRTITVKNGND